MASLPWIPAKTQQEEEEDERSYGRHTELVSTLPKVDHLWATGLALCKFHGFWFLSHWLLGILAAREHFVARPSDIFVASFPKSGTTWLKAMAFSIVHRGRHPPHDEGHPLRQANPHDVVDLLEDLYFWRRNPDLTAVPSPRIFSTHCPYSILPQSVKDSGSRIIHVARDLKDAFVSYWHFREGMKPEGAPSVSMEDAFSRFVRGISLSGPFWEHILEYWQEHLRRPDKVLFLRYEAMKGDPIGSVKRLAEFLGCPFSADEEKQGVPESISELCSFRSLRNMDVNRDGVLEGRPQPIPNRLYFRRGEVGDSANHLTLEMAEKMDMITHQKLGVSGLKF